MGKDQKRFSATPFLQTLPSTRYSSAEIQHKSSHCVLDIHFWAPKFLVLPLCFDVDTSLIVYIYSREMILGRLVLVTHALLSEDRNHYDVVSRRLFNTVCYCERLFQLGHRS